MTGGRPRTENRRNAFGIAAWTALVILSSAALLRGQSAGFAARVVLGPVKIRPYGVLPGAANGSLTCARGEFCSFQVVVTARRENVAGVDVSLSDLSMKGGAVIRTSGPDSRATIYREGFMNVFYRSSEQGEIGEWPDPLIPRVSDMPGESSNAFPVDVVLISPAYKRYRAENGHSLPGGRGLGAAISGGSYRGGLVRRYVIEIAKPGAIGVATFRWWGDPGSAQPSAERPTSTSPVPLDSGVSVAFRGDGHEDDFLTGDEFWIFAGPERHQPVWVDVFIPTDSPAGTFSGEIRVTARGRSALLLPVKIEALDFELPATTQVANTFLMSWAGVAAAHFGQALVDARKGEERRIQLGKAYASAALRNGITLAPSEDLVPIYKFNPDGGPSETDYSEYDAAVASFMDGTGTPRGARWTSLPLPRLKDLTDPQRKAALRDFVRHARERGWYDRLYDYTYDEPRTLEDFAALKARARLVREVDPGIPRLVTTNLSPDLVGLVTRWCPLVNDLDPKYGSPREHWRKAHRAARADYDARLRARDSLWWYQSCESHGCDGSGRSPEYDNWPNYMIDSSAVANRVFGFLTAVTDRVSGILYFDVAFADYRSAAPRRIALSPWESQYYFGGNGDGSVFYPGTPDRVGGHRDIPIESLRMKMIRDSFYDAEYALLLRKLGDAGFLQREVGRVVERAWRWDADSRAWLELREKLGRRIAARISTR
jgi:hypothetical protein